MKIIPATLQAPIPKDRKIGDKLVFSCPKGFGLQGTHHELYCLESGQWSSALPYCAEVRCPLPVIPQHGYLEGYIDTEGSTTGQQPSSYDAGDIVQFTCEHGYMLEGNPISICQESGRWSGPKPRCTPACTYPGLMHGARLLSEVSFFYRVNQTIEFECADGYEMKGNAAIKCIESGRWSGSIPECNTPGRT